MQMRVPAAEPRFPAAYDLPDATGHFGPYGGTFVAETLQEALGELRDAYEGIDVLEDGLSSVYTFFDPNTAGASFGTYNILWQAAQCLALELPYLYLGYWIASSPKMSYKSRFRPIECLLDGHWRPFDPDRNSL